MTLFEECKQALSSNIRILDVRESRNILILLGNLIKNDNLSNWNDIEYVDYDKLEDLSIELKGYDTNVYVVADDKDIPVFQTNLQLALENFYDISSLSTKVFIFNKEELLFPLFPTEGIRYARFKKN